LAGRDEFFVNNPLDDKENDEGTFDFDLQLSRHFWSALNRAGHSDTQKL
jgi:hypothetical protein